MGEFGLCLTVFQLGYKPSPAFGLIIRLEFTLLVLLVVRTLNLDWKLHQWLSWFSDPHTRALPLLQYPRQESMSWHWSQGTLDVPGVKNMLTNERPHYFKTQDHKNQRKIWNCSIFESLNRNDNYLNWMLDKKSKRDAICAGGEI